MLGVVTKKPSLLFQAQARDGRTSECWRVWRAKHSDDIFASALSMRGTVKVSLHRGGVWQHGFSAEWSDRVGVAASDRLFQRWKHHPQTVPGWTQALLIVVTDEDLCTPINDRPDVLNVPMPADGRATVFQLWLEAPTAAAGLKMEDAFGVGSLELIDRGRLWVVAAATTLPWRPRERLRTAVEDARRDAAVRGKSTEDAQRIIVHGVDDASGTLILVEVAITDA